MCHTACRHLLDWCNNQEPWVCDDIIKNTTLCNWHTIKPGFFPKLEHLSNFFCWHFHWSLAELFAESSTTRQQKRMSLFHFRSCWRRCCKEQSFSPPSCGPIRTRLQLHQTMLLHQLGPIQVWNLILFDEWEVDSTDRSGWFVEWTVAFSGKDAQSLCRRTILQGSARTSCSRLDGWMRITRSGHTIQPIFQMTGPDRECTRESMLWRTPILSWKRSSLLEDGASEPYCSKECLPALLQEKFSSTLQSLLFALGDSTESTLTGSTHRELLTWPTLLPLSRWTQQTAEKI